VFDGLYCCVKFGWNDVGIFIIFYNMQAFFFPFLLKMLLLAALWGLDDLSR